MIAAHAADTDAVAHAFVAALDETLVLGGPDGHHLAQVRRLRPGERVTGADGAGHWREYEVRSTARDRLELRAVGAVAHEPEPAVRIVLAFAPTKGGATDRVVQHATELGVDELRPLHTQRTVVRWDAERERAARTRLTRVAHEAAAQCFRSRLPVVGPTLTARDLAGCAGLVIASREGERRLEPLAAREWTLAVGPEGGFTVDELAAVGAAPRLSLGQHMLRAETAAVVGCSILAMLRGP